MSKENKTRNHIGNKGVGQNRDEVFKQAIKQYKKAKENGFYLEAIAICESLITDRMESRIGELTKREVKFGMLRNLKDILMDYIETDSDLIKIYDEILNKWAPKRNIAIHQAVKISKKEEKKWDKYIKDSEQTAKEGMDYFRQLDKSINKHRIKAK